MSIKFLVLGGGGVFWVWRGGGEGRFYFYGRADFSECSSGIALHSPPPKGPVAPVTLQLPGVSHVKLPLKKCCATVQGGVAATCGCRATLCK